MKYELICPICHAMIAGSNKIRLSINQEIEMRTMHIQEQHKEVINQ